jgi:hypothetical protein
MLPVISGIKPINPSQRQLLLKKNSALNKQSPIAMRAMRSGYWIFIVISVSGRQVMR